MTTEPITLIDMHARTAYATDLEVIRAIIDELQSERHGLHAARTGDRLAVELRLELHAPGEDTPEHVRELALQAEEALNLETELMAGTITDHGVYVIAHADYDIKELTAK